MPELPEVETVRRGLVPVLEGRRLARVEVRRPDLRTPFPPDFAARLTGRVVRGLERRAKYLLWRLDDGMVMILHLGMSGRLFIDGDGAARFHHDVDPKNARHDHVVFETDAGARIVFNDHRRFGLMTLASDNALGDHPLIRDLGPEPLGPDFAPGVLAAAMAGRRAPVKAVLLDQRRVAGLGNIYVCEALWRAGVDPRREAGSIPKARIARLTAMIRAVLTEAIEAGGSSLRDYVQASGDLGYFQHRFAVYDREGEACPRPRCRGTVERIVQSNRSTFFCGTCQT